MGASPWWILLVDILHRRLFKLLLYGKIQIAWSAILNESYILWKGHLEWVLLIICIVILVILNSVCIETAGVYKIFKAFTCEWKADARSAWTYWREASGPGVHWSVSSEARQLWRKSCEAERYGCFPAKWLHVLGRTIMVLVTQKKKLNRTYK